MSESVKSRPTASDPTQPQPVTSADASQFPGESGQELNFEQRVACLEQQMRKVLPQQPAPRIHREYYEELRRRVTAIGGELRKSFAFDAAGNIIGTAPTQAYYQRPYWLTRDSTYPVTANLTVELPLQFGELEMAIARNEQLYQQRIHTLAYADERPAYLLIQESDFEPHLKQLARLAGGSLDLKYHHGHTYAYYYRYKRLKTETVFTSLLKLSPYHTSGKHRYSFWLPIDYVLLRQLIERDTIIYAQLPAEMLRPGFPPRQSLTEPTVDTSDAANSPLRDTAAILNAIKAKQTNPPPPR